MLGIDDMESDEILEIHLKFEIISCLVEWATLISRLNPLHFACMIALHSARP
jgi:hypothetical protein